MYSSIKIDVSAPVGENEKIKIKVHLASCCTVSDMIAALGEVKFQLMHDYAKALKNRKDDPDMTVQEMNVYLDMRHKLEREYVTSKKLC